MVGDENGEASSPQECSRCKAIIINFEVIRSWPIVLFCFFLHLFMNIAAT